MSGPFLILVLTDPLLPALILVRHHAYESQEVTPDEKSLLLLAWLWGLPILNSLYLDYRPFTLAHLN